MGTTGPPEDSDVQNLFEHLSQPGNNDLPPLSYANSSHPFHNFPASSFPQDDSYGQPGSFSLLAHGSTFFQHPSFSNDQMLAAHQIHYNSQLSQPPPLPVPASLAFQTKSLSRPSSPSTDTTRLKALLTHQSTEGLDTSVSLESSILSAKLINLEMSFPSTSFTAAPPSAPPASLAPASPYGRMANNIPARGRHLKGEHVFYDIDGRLPGNVPPQLEVTPITMYTSQSLFFNDRQIAVSMNYICYGLRPNRHIRILNINTALRSILRGHSERVTDMVFFGEDVHLLASASSDGRVFVRQIVEGPNEENKLQIADQILLAIQFIGDWDSVHPRICWLCHTQDLLVVGINKYVFVVDIPTVRQFAAPNGFDVEDPVHCPVVSLIEGVHCINEHDGDITDVTTSQWGLSASASNDGMIRLWKDQFTASFIPHQGQQVGAIAFLSVPLCPDHIVLLSAGPLCRELKLWVPATRDGWLLQSGQFKWKCIQTLELTSSTGGNSEDVFFNQVLVVPRANLILLANAKKSALYVIHVSFGSSPASTRLDYVTEYSVTWPILSFTATSENVVDGGGFVQIYCVQTQAIQQYSLNVSQCLPPIGQDSHNDLVHSTHYANSLDTDRVVTSERSLNTHEASSNMNVRCLQSTSENSSCLESVAVERNDVIAMKDNVSFPVSQPVPFNIDMVSAEDSRVIGISGDAKETTRDVPVHVSKISAPAPQVEGAIQSPRDSPLSKARARSPADDRPPFHVIITRENTAYVQPEQPTERTLVSTVPSSPKYAMWDALTSSPRRQFNDVGKINDDNEWHPSISAPVLPDSQTNIGSTMHLITPSELMSMVARSKIVVEGGLTGSSSQGSSTVKELIKPIPTSDLFIGKGDIKGDVEALTTIETKEMNETARLLADEMGPKKVVLLRRGVPDFDPRMDRSATVSLIDGENEPGHMEIAQLTQDFDLSVAEEAQCEDENDAPEEREALQMVQEDEITEHFQDISGKADNASAFSVASQTRRKKNKNKTDTNALTNLPPPSSAPLSSMASTSEQDFNKCSSGALTSKLVAQMTAMQESVNQLVAMQRDFQKQTQGILAAPVAKEMKRVEAVIGQRMEKVIKAHMEAMWARLQEDFAKREKADRDQLQQLSSYLSNYLNKDLPVALERALKKEFSALGPSIARLLAPCVEKSITVTVNEAFQKGIAEKGISQLEKSTGAKIEASLSRQLQSQFQTTGKIALQEALRSSLEGSVIPSFERSCQAMFAQVDAALQKGLIDSQTHAQQQLATSAIASTLQEAVTSATLVATSLKGELADGQRKLLSLIDSIGISRAPYVVNTSLSDKVMTVQHVEESLDPTKELARLLSERKMEEAFNKALSLSNVGIVSWLCSQVELEKLLTITPPPLSQGVLLALVQQLGCDLGNDTGKKLTWIKDATLALNPHDPGLPPHVMRHFLEKLYNNLHALLTTNLSPDLILSTRLVIHVVNSLLTACK